MVLTEEERGEEIKSKKLLKKIKVGERGTI